MPSYSENIRQRQIYVGKQGIGMKRRLSITAVIIYFFVVKTITGEGFCDKDSCDSDVQLDNRHLVLSHRNNQFLRIRFPSLLEDERSPENCLHDESRQAEWCFNWRRYVRLQIRKFLWRNNDCFNVIWTPSSKDFIPHDCVSMKDASWYGGAEVHFQRWPLNDQSIPMQEFVSKDLVVETASYGNVLEPLWVNSDGVGIVIDDATPLFIGVNDKNDNELCFKAKIYENYMFNEAMNRDLNYTVCKTENVKEAYQVLHSLVLKPPAGVPDLRMMSKPIISTWVRYKTEINQEKLLHLADEIHQYGFPHSQLEIDDIYSTEYGEFDFDTEKFPNPLEMTTKLKERGFRITTWIVPFADLKSNAFSARTGKRFWMMNRENSAPALINWWHGISPILDPTNPEATEWFLSRLNLMKSTYNIDSFKFDAGEMTFFPRYMKPYSEMSNIGFLTKHYVEMVSKLGNMVEVRCGYKSQEFPIFVRTADKESKWGYDNGLKTLIPTILTIGIMGYPYILPDMIGGNGYTESSLFDVLLPERELFIRWMQLTAYLPAMQFSVMPWDYDDEVVSIALNMTKIHEDVVFPILLKAAEEAQINGSPLIRPLWWVDPKDPVALTIDSEFLVGNDLLVAPVLEKGGRSRDIYLPKGKWRDNLRGGLITGEKWILNVKADLHEIPTFSRHGVLG